MDEPQTNQSIIFDAGPIISLTLNGLLWLMEPLKSKFNGDFCITQETKQELVQKPLKTKKFEFEALQVLRLINKEVIHVATEPNIDDSKNNLLNIANQCFSCGNESLTIVHPGEISSIALAIALKSKAVVIDERTARMLIEEPYGLAKVMENKLHAKITVNDANIKKFREITKDIKVIRSSELVTMAYKLGVLDHYIPKSTVSIGDPRRTLLDSLLWGVKLHGCSISEREIDEIIRMEK